MQCAKEEWLDKQLKNDEAEAKALRGMEEQNFQFQSKWPNYCRACGGWGGATDYQSVPWGSTTASTPIFEVCDALPETQCHRCGQHGLGEGGDGPCKVCGWDYDDGLI
jgi:hypothetical protein